MRVDYKKFDSSRNYGVELEVGKEIPRTIIASIIKSISQMKVLIANYTQSVNNAHWVVKTDASCGKRIRINGMNEGGYEIASFVATGISDAIKISKVAAELRKNSVESNTNCGYHIHVNVADFDEEQMGNLVGYWLLIEDIFFNAVPYRRTTSKYCKKVKIKKLKFLKEIYKFDSGKKLWEAFRPKILNIRNPIEKRYSLNLLNYHVASKTKFKRKTIEFRFPEGTLCHETIKNFILLLVNFVENVKKLPVPDINSTVSVKKTLQYLGLSGDKSLYLLDLDLMKAKIWFLKRIIRYSKNSDFRQEAKLFLARIHRGVGNAKM